MREIMEMTNVNENRIIGQKDYTIIIIYNIFLFLISVLYVNQQSSIVNVVALIGTLVLVVFMRERSVIPMVIAAYQFTYWLPYIYITLLLLVIYIIKCKGRFRIKKSVVLYLIVALFGLYSLSYPNSSFDYYLRVTISQFALVLLLSSDASKDTVFEAMFSYNIGFFLKSIIMIIVGMKYTSLSYIVEKRLGFGTLGPFMPEWLEIQNENSFALAAVLAIAFAYIMYEKGGRTRGQRTSYIITFCLATIIGLMTKSRTFILALAILIFMIIFVRKTSFSTRIRNIVIYASILFAGYLIIKSLMPNIYEGVIARFMYDDITNGRTSIFAQINDRFFGSDLFGVLFGYLSIKNYGGILNFDFAFHNVVQRAYVLHGVVGFFFILWMLISGITDIVKKRDYKFDLLYAMPLIITLCAGMGSNPDLIIFLFCIFILRLGQNEERDRIEV